VSDDVLREDARAIEALLFLSPEPLSTETLAGLLDGDRDRVLAAIDRLMAAFGWVLRTRPDMSVVCDRLRERPPEDRLSPAAMETLAVVAYLEPVSRPDIGRLRGVSVDSTVANLVERGLLEESGRADVSGAILYRTTRAFQQRFGLRDQRDLPPIERFELSGPQADDLRRRLSEAGHMDGVPDEPVVEQGAPQPPEMAEAPTVIQEGPVVTETPDGSGGPTDGEDA
jgi:segregation and condensation protein B